MTDSPEDDRDPLVPGGDPDRDPDVDGTDPGFRALTDYVERELDFATSHYNDDYLRRRVASRMRRQGTATYDDYRRLLADHETERRALLEALSINVTGFFRDPDVWEAIRDVLRDLADERSLVSVWSAACADGREPYSLAMLARADPEIDADRVRITATDISEVALEKARRGEYTASHTTDIAGELDFLSAPGRFVNRVETDGRDTFVVSEAIRRAVTFERHDLIRDTPKSGLDLVLCRNLSIYIDRAYKDPVIDTVGASLRPGGYLVIGKTETVPRALRHKFVTYDSARRIYRRRSPDDADEWTVTDDHGHDDGSGPGRDRPDDDARRTDER